MIMKHIEGCNLIVDGTGWQLRVSELNGGPGRIVKKYESAWQPTPEELEVINRGGIIILASFGSQPSVLLSVGEPALTNGS